jgi:DNA-binding transcriptional LysR family regulator
LKESTSAVQKSALLADTLDVAILRPPVDENVFAIMRLRNEKFLAALHKNDKRAARKRLVLKDFDDSPFIGYSADGAGYSFRKLTAMFEKEHINPMIDHQLDQNHAILSLVSAGLGAALVPDSLAILSFPNVVFREVDCDDGRPLEMYMAWRSQNKNPALEPFLALCRSMIESAPKAKKAS